MSTKTFSVACTAAILLLVGGVGLFNWIVDPYWYFRAVEIAGFNQVKPHAAGNERLVKPALVRKLRPEAIILGNSVAEIGLPPTHRGFTNNGVLTSYNLAMPDARWNEIYCLAMFAIRHAAVKRLVVGTAGEGTGGREEDCPPDASFGRPDYGKLLFSRSALAVSRETLRQQSLPQVMTREGQWYFHPESDLLMADKQQATVVRNQCQVVPGWEIRPDRAHPRKAEVQAQEGASLRKLIRLARTKQIELVFVFYPTHVLMNEFHRACQGAESKWDAIWRVVSIAEQESDPLRTQVWDFSAYVPLNAERLIDPNPRREPLWREILHFNEPVGGAAFDAIYLGRSNYGNRVSVGSYDELVATREDERIQFLRDNPWVRQEFDVIARHVAALPAEPRH